MTISTTTNRDAFTGDGTQTSYPLSFPVVSSTHIDVNVNDATVAASGNYTVTISGTSATVVFTTAPASAAKIVIRRIVPQTQTVDYVPYDTFPAETHEAALDKLTQIDQQLQEDINRSMQLPVSDNTTSSYMPSPSAGKALKWNSAGTALENSTDDVDGITTAAAASATAAATSATASATSATSSSTSATASAASATSAAASYDSFDDRYLGAKASDPTVDNDGDALIDGALFFDSTNNVMKVYDLGTTTWLRTTPTSTDQGHINTVSGIAANVTTVAGIASDVTAVAADASDIGVVAADGTDIGLVAGSIANVNTTAGSISNVNTTAGSITNVNNVGGSIANVNTVAGSIADVNRYAAEYTIASTAPSSPTEGDLWYDSSSGVNLLKFYNGSSWVGIAPGITSETDPNAAALALALG